MEGQERAVKLEVNMAELNNEVKNIGVSLNTHIRDQKETEEKMLAAMDCHVKKDDFKALEETINKFFEKAEKRFASKWAETGLLWVLGTLGSALIGGVVILGYKIVKIVIELS